MPANPPRSIRVQVVYRNYIPLNSPYMSLWTAPPEGIVFDIPKPKPFLKYAFPIYQRFGNNLLVKRLVRIANRLFFEKPPANQQADFLFYIGMIPNAIPTLPFYIDLEHVYALLNFVRDDEALKQKVFNTLRHPLCRGIIPISEAAANTVRVFFDHDATICGKIQVIYPALPVYQDTQRTDPTSPILKNKDKYFDFLFVGKDSLRKGIQEVLPAFTELAKRLVHIRLWVVGDIPSALVQQYQSHPRIFFDTPRYSSKEIIERYFLPADVFVMPTHADTFGMVYLEALSCGKPVILTRQFATPEIVQDRINGLLLEHEPLFLDRAVISNERFGDDYLLPPVAQQALISNLVKKMELLATDSVLFQNLKSQTAQAIRQGKFSISERNKKLTELFTPL